MLTDIRAAALEYAQHGWPVQPGTFQVAGSHTWLGRTGATGIEPITEEWQQAGNTDGATALDVWTRRPYSILIACGAVFDAIEVPEHLGRALIEPLRDSECVPPTIGTAFGTWTFLTTPVDRATPPDHGIVVHTSGSWMVLPSTRDAHLGCRWRLHPRSLGWEIPDSRTVIEVITAVAGMPHPIGAR